MTRCKATFRTRVSAVHANGIDSQGDCTSTMSVELAVHVKLKFAVG